MGSNGGAKARMQQAVLVAVVLAFLGAVGYMFRDSILPYAQPTSPGRARTAPQKIDAGFFGRADFKELKQYGDVPVKVLQVEKSDPFRVQ